VAIGPCEPFEPREIRVVGHAERSHGGSPCASHAA
jgi:hypothetical protein